VEAPARGGLARAVFVGPDGLRAGWRIVLFALLAGALAAFLGTSAALLGLRVEGTLGFALMLAAVLGASWTLLAVLERRPPGALGFPLRRAAARESLLGTAVGGALLAAAVVPLAATGMARWVAGEGSVPEYVAVLASTLGFFALAAAFEEALFRGYPFQALVRGIGAGPAVVASSALFAVAHGNNPNVAPLGLVNIFLAGVMLAVAYLRTRSLWFATGVHLGWNWTMASLLDFPVSGFVSDTPLYDVVARGPEVWTGGAFGPEAGLPATAALLGGTLWLARSAAFRAPPAEAAPPAPPDAAAA
jgi:uncharacterized protein